MALRTTIASKVKAGTPVITRKDLPNGTTPLVILAGMPLIVNGSDIEDFDSMTPLDQMLAFTKYELCKYAKAVGRDDDMKINNASWVFSGVKHGEYGDFADPCYDLGLLNPQTPAGWNGPPRCFSLSIAYPILHKIETDDFGNWIEGTGELVLFEITQDSNEPNFVIEPIHQSLAALFFNKLSSAKPRQGVINGTIVTLDGSLGTIVEITKNSKAAPRDMYKFEVSNGVANPEALMEYQNDVSMAIQTYRDTSMRRWAYYNDLLDTIADDGSNVSEVALSVVNAIRSRVLDAFDFSYIEGDNESISSVWSSKVDLMSIEDTNTVDIAEEKVQRVSIKGKRRKGADKVENESMNEDDLPF